MLKTIRKYNKLILAVGGTLLLVSFLVPQAIEQIGQASMNRAVGEMDGRKITVGDYDRAARELQALEEFYQGFGGQFPLGLDERKDVEHWMLLTTEADRAGMVGGASEGAQLIPIFARERVRRILEQQFGRMADQFRNANPDAVREQEQAAERDLAEYRLRLASRMRLGEEGFDETLAKLQGVFRLLNSYTGAERLSAGQARLISQRLGDTVRIDAAVLPARRIAEGSEIEPTEEELQQHFLRFRDLRPGEGEYGIGYMLPPRVKLEWIELNRSAMRDAISVSLIDATKHYQQNRDRFPGEFEAERAAVEAELRDAELERVMGTAESVVRSAILGATRPLEQQGEYYVLPEDWAERRPDLVALAAQVTDTVRESHGVEIPTPTVQIIDDRWLDQSAVAQQPGIGSATIRFGRQEGAFPQAVFGVREIAGENPLGLQVGVPSTELVARGRDDSVYYYTVLDAAGEAVPESRDELLNPDRLVADLKSLRVFEELAASPESLAQRAASEGLESFAESFGTFVPTSTIEGFEPQPRPRVSVVEDARVTQEGTANLGLIENNEAVIEAVLNAARDIDPRTPIEEVPIERRVVVAPVPGSLSVLVGRIERIEPLTRELLPIYARAARQRYLREIFPPGMPVPFQYEVLKQRHGLVMKEQDDETVPEEEQPVPEPAVEDA